MRRRKQKDSSEIFTWNCVIEAMKQTYKVISHTDVIYQPDHQIKQYHSFILSMSFAHWWYLPYSMEVIIVLALWRQNATRPCSCHHGGDGMLKACTSASTSYPTHCWQRFQCTRYCSRYFTCIISFSHNEFIQGTIYNLPEIWGDKLICSTQ